MAKKTYGQADGKVHDLSKLAEEDAPGRPGVGCRDLQGPVTPQPVPVGAALMGLFSKAEARLAHEKESYRMGREHLKQVKADSPDLYVKGYWRMTDAGRRAAVRRQK